ncbi:MAG: hypothetical protein ACHQUC_02125 [Chlamydiales bacterium]
MINTGIVFVDRARDVSSAISPIGMNLAHYQLKLDNEASSKLAVQYLRALSIIATPLDYLIQVVSAPIWILYDDLRSNATLLDWLMTPVRLPAKVLIGALIATLTQFIEMTAKIKSIYSCRLDELNYEYQGKWIWLKNPEKLVDEAEKPCKVQYHQPKMIPGYETIVDKLKRIIIPLLESKNYTHCYINIQNHSPIIWFSPIDGRFQEHPMPNEGKSSFLLGLLDAQEVGEKARTEMLYVTQARMQDPFDDPHLSAERQAYLCSGRELDNLRRYSFLPLRIIQQIENLPKWEGKTT